MYELRKGVRGAKRGNVGKRVETRCAPTDKHWSQLHRSDRPVSSLNGSWIIDSILITRLPSIQSRNRYTLNFVYRASFTFLFFLIIHNYIINYIFEFHRKCVCLSFVHVFLRIRSVASTNKCYKKYVIKEMNGNREGLIDYRI